MKQKSTIKVSKVLKGKLDKLVTNKKETYEDIIDGLLKWKWYKERNKCLEQVIHQKDEENNRLLKEIAEIYKSHNKRGKE